MTLELVTQRVEILEKKMTALMANNTTDHTNPDKKSKKEKKFTKSDSDDDAPNKKQVSSYIFFGKAKRDTIKGQLVAFQPDSKIKDYFSH